MNATTTAKTSSERVVIPDSVTQCIELLGADNVLDLSDIAREVGFAESLLVTPEALQGLLACDLYSDMPFDIANTLRDALGELRAKMWREPCRGELIFFDQTEVEFSMTLLVRRNIDSPQPYTLVTLR